MNTNRQSPSHVCMSSLTLALPPLFSVCLCSLTLALPPLFPSVCVLTHIGSPSPLPMCHTHWLSLPSSHVCPLTLALPPLFPWCVSSLTLALPPLFTRLYIQCHSHVIRELQKWYRAVFLLLFSKVPLVSGV